MGAGDRGTGGYSLAAAARWLVSCFVLSLDETLVKFDVCAQSGPLSSGFQGWPLQASQHWSDEHWGFDGNSVVPI